MNVLLIGNLPEDAQESMQRYTALLDAGLRARGHAVTVAAPRLRLARLGPRYRYGGLPKYLGYFDKFVLFPAALRRLVRALQPDVVHLTDHASAVYRPALRGRRVICTCHDLLQIRAARSEFPRQRPGWSGRRQQEGILADLARLPHLACVSAQTRLDALRLTGLAPSRVSVVAPALNHPYRPVAPSVAWERLSGLRLDPRTPGGFLLQVGGGQWYKNRPGLLALFAALRRRLPAAPVLAMVGPPLSADDDALARSLGVSPLLVPLTGVSNGQLEALYALAEGLLFPSWAEGFGWPVAEAQACGCPVFASNLAPMTEVGGRGAVYFDPADPDAAAVTVASAWDRRPTLRAVGLAGSARWRPDLMFEAYEALYRQIVA